MDIRSPFYDLQAILEEVYQGIQCSTQDNSLQLTVPPLYDMREVCETIQVQCNRVNISSNEETRIMTVKQVHNAEPLTPESFQPIEEALSNLSLLERTIDNRSQATNSINRKKLSLEELVAQHPNSAQKILTAITHTLEVDPSGQLIPELSQQVLKDYGIMSNENKLMVYFNDLANSTNGLDTLDLLRNACNSAEKSQTRINKTTTEIGQQKYKSPDNAMQKSIAETLKSIELIAQATLDPTGNPQNIFVIKQLVWLKAQIMPAYVEIEKLGTQDNLRDYIHTLIQCEEFRPIEFPFIELILVAIDEGFDVLQVANHFIELLDRSITSLKECTQ